MNPGLALAWRPSHYDGGRTLQVPANFGTLGSGASWDWTPTYNTPPARDPSIPTYNRLVPIVWAEYVLSPEDAAIIGQVAVRQQSRMLPATFVVPGTASLGE